MAPPSALELEVERAEVAQFDTARMAQFFTATNISMVSHESFRVACVCELHVVLALQQGAATSLGR